MELLGLQVGQRLDSHHESKAMQRLHEQYLRGVGAAWHHPGPFLEWVSTAEGERNCGEYLQRHVQGDFDTLLGYRNNLRGWWRRMRLRSGIAWGWKEPRTTLFAPFWLQFFPDALILDVVRHPLAVAMSIRQRDLKFRAAGDAPTPGLDQLDYCLRLALTYVEAGDRMAGRSPNYRRVHFETLQGDTEKALGDLATFCRLRPTDAQIRQAARTIRPSSTPTWPGFSEQDEQKLRASQTMVNKLGYELPFARKA